MTGIRSIWNQQAIAGSLTPDKLGAILRNAVEGDPAAYLTLAEEMEERDAHYAAVLGTRKRAVLGLEPIIEPGDASDVAKKLVDACNHLICSPNFTDLLDGCLDGLAKGYAAVEIIWQGGQLWWPAKYVWRDPRFFRFDRTTMTELRLLTDEDSFEGVALPPYKFVTHVPRLKQGIPIRNGIARLVAASHMCKSFGVTDWMAFAEVFGMPLRIGRYGSTATMDDINTLVNAIANLGTDAAAAIPDSMKIEFEDGVAGRGGEILFQTMADWFDRQVSKAVLGQTMTTDAQSAGIGSNQATVHNEVREDILASDARQLEATINRDLIKPFVDLNFGPQESYPRFRLPIPDKEDLQLLMTALPGLLDRGLEVDQQVILNKLRLPAPGKDAKLMGANRALGMGLNHRLPHPDHRLAINAQGSDDDTVDILRDTALADWQQQMQPMLDPIKEHLAQCGSYEEFMDGLAALSDKMGADKLAEALAIATFKARGLGNATDKAN